MTDKLILGIPSKGRLQENTYDYFARAGLKIKRSGGDRTYTGVLDGVDNVLVQFLQAGEIPGFLEDGTIHFGVTGQDLLAEKSRLADRTPLEITAMGFGRADLIVAVPQSWIDVDTMADLDEVAQALHIKQGRRFRIATKYFNLTRQFFAEHGIADYRLVESLGATEGAPNSGAAEAIVDITSTGSTLKANALKILSDGIILKSQACLAASRTAPWTDATKSAAQQILDMIDAEAAAQKSLIVRCILEKPLDQDALNELNCQSGDLTNTDCVITCPEENLYQLVTILRAKGARSINASSADFVFEATGPLYNRLSNLF